MKCPKYIREMIIDRKRCAVKYMNLDVKLAEWAEKKGIVCEYLQGGFVDTLVNPDMALVDSLEAIRCHREVKAE